MVDTKEIGETSEARVVFELKEQGFTVLTPFGDNEKYDLVYDTGDGFVRAQVKTGRMKDGKVVFHTQTAGHNNTSGTYHKGYTKSDIDVFVVYCPQNRTTYIVDVEDAPNTRMALRIEEPGNGQKKGINLAEEFELTERFK